MEQDNIYNTRYYLDFKTNKIRDNIRSRYHKIMKAQIQIVYFNLKTTASNTRVFEKASCINN